MSSKLHKVSNLALFIPAALALSVSAVYASVDVSINVGTPPIIIPAPVPPPPMPYMTIDQDIDFVYPAQLGFYVAVGVPYDLFFVRNNYYLCRDGRWYRAAGSRGQWVPTRYRELPPGLRKHKMDRIRYYRDTEHHDYSRDRDHYRGRHFRMTKDEWKARRHAEREHRKEERREVKEYREEMKREDREDRKAEKEERKHDKRGRD